MSKAITQKQAMASLCDAIEKTPRSDSSRADDLAIVREYCEQSEPKATKKKK